MRECRGSQGICRKSWKPRGLTSRPTWTRWQCAGVPRALLGLAVVRELEKGATQDQVADSLGVVTEQVRRYRQAYRDWLRDHNGQSPED